MSTISRPHEQDDGGSPTTPVTSAEDLTVSAREVLDVVLDALDIPYAATVGDDETRQKILDQRLMQLLVSLRALRDEPDRDAAWGLEYLREKLAENPATGYRAWDEALASKHEQAHA